MIKIVHIKQRKVKKKNEKKKRKGRKLESPKDPINKMYQNVTK